MVDCPQDQASDIITAYVKALRDTYHPKGPCPPVNGSTNVRLLTGAGPAAAAFDLHRAQTKDCKEPMLWVRLARRYRVQPGGSLAQPVIDNAVRCLDTPRVVQVEIGVARCAVAEQQRNVKWDDYQLEAEQALDDSARIENALCLAGSALRAKGHLVGSNTIDPYGPEGTVILWVGVAYVQFI